MVLLTELRVDDDTLVTIKNIKKIFPAHLAEFSQRQFVHRQSVNDRRRPRRWRGKSIRVLEHSATSSDPFSSRVYIGYFFYSWDYNNTAALLWSFFYSHSRIVIIIVNTFAQLSLFFSITISNIRYALLSPRWKFTMHPREKENSHKNFFLFFTQHFFHFSDITRATRE